MTPLTQQIVAQSIYSTKSVKNLTKQQELFAFHLSTGASMTECAKSVGASLDQAHEWIKDRDVVTVVKGFADINMEGAQVTRDKLATLLFQSYYKAGNAMEEISALREIGKLKGLYAPEVQEVTVKAHNVRQIESADDATLAKLAGMDDPTVIEHEDNSYYER